MRNWLPRLALLVALAAAPARAASVYGEIEISMAPEPRGNNNHGYTEYLFYITNKGDRPRSVALAMPHQSHGFGGGTLSRVSRRTEVAAKRTATLSLLYPARPMIGGRDVDVFIDGVRMADPMPLVPVSGSGVHARHGGGWRHGRAMPAVKMHGGSETLVYYTQGLEEAFFRVKGPGGVMPGGGAGGPGGFGGPPGAGGPGIPGGIGLFEEQPGLNSALLRAGVPVSAWSDNWLGYTRYDGVIVTPKDINELAVSSEYTKRVLRALWRYAETGGTLVVVGGGKPPLPKAWDRTPAARGANWTVYQVGFGQCWHHPEAASARWKLDDWFALQSAFNSTNSPWMSARSISDLHQTFPVVEDLGVPVRGLFALMLVFAIAIGPVNLLLLSRLKRRMWMLWTVPALSALTCGAVFAYMIVAEGWSGHARVAGVTLLDQIEERATTLGRAAYYSPMTPGDGLRFSEDVEVMAMGFDHTTEDSSCTIEWTGEQHLRRGWVTARVPAHYSVRRSETQSKPRLSLHREADGRLIAVNALGSDILALDVADKTGLIYHADRVPAGQEVTLERAGNQTAKAIPTDAWRRLYGTTDWGMKMYQSVFNAEEVLTPNSYLAVVDQTPFLDQGLKAATVRPVPSVVIGVFADITSK